MSTPTRTNPAYAHLAYQVAIAERLIEDILEKYIGNEVATPIVEIECTQLVRDDAIVPQDEILHFVDRLKNHKAQLDRELTRFEFVRRPDEQGLGTNAASVNPLPAAATTEPEAASSPEVEEKGRRRRKRGSRGSRKRPEGSG